MKSYLLQTAEYHIVIPVEKCVINSSSRLLLQSAFSYAQGLFGKPVNALGINTKEKKIWKIQDKIQVARLRCFGPGVHFVMNIGFLLSDTPPINELIKAALKEDIACCGSKSTKETFAFAFLNRKKLKTAYHLKNDRYIWSALFHLTACVDDDQKKIDNLWNVIKSVHFLPLGKALADNSPSMHGIKNTYRKPWRLSSQYINMAFKEIISRPMSFIDIGKNPILMAKALLEQREVSMVPWIFNSLINDIEFRIGASEIMSFPPEIHLSLTGRCNIECRFCGYTHGISRLDFVNPTQIDRMSYLRYLQSLRLNSGLGEPTLNKHLPKIIKRLSDKFPHLSLSFFTNAILLDNAELIDILIGNVDWINVSLNAGTKYSWKNQCNVDQFEKVCNNLKNLHKTKRYRGSILPLVFGSMVLNKANIEDLPLMPALCRELGIDRFTAFSYFALGYNNPKKYGPEMTLEANRDQYDHIYIKTLREALIHSISLELPPLSYEASVHFGIESRPMYDFANIERDEWPLGRFLSGLDFIQPPDSYCHFLWRYAAIGSTFSIGHSSNETHYIYPCIGPLSSVDLSRRMPFRFPNENDFLALWQNPVLTHLREAQREFGVCEICDICRNRNTRNPELFKKLENMVGSFSEKWR